MKLERHNPLLEDNQISLFRSFYKEGLQKHSSIEEWWRYISNFVRTMAQWSYLCYLTKLGDRHGGNILVTTAGKLIHIDYEYNFAHGLMLPCPEWVPFRLTDALVSVMGVFK
jgi:phosphatidylinositol kinase/protein kinase (PI-3  family)